MYGGLRYTIKAYKRRSEKQLKRATKNNNKPLVAEIKRALVQHNKALEFWTAQEKRTNAAL